MMYVQRTVPVVQAASVAEAVAAFKGNWSALPHWLLAAYESGLISAFYNGIHFDGKDGRQFADMGDWIVSRHDGSLERQTAAEFHHTYEPVAPPPAE
jgi:hypothetical protein